MIFKNYTLTINIWRIVMSFNKDFVWGVSTSAYQIEGSHDKDGKGLDIWDVFCKQEGRIENNENGDNACNHYQMYKEDVQLMKNLGIKAYRFSINWSRIIPNGIGEVNKKGIEFYNNLIDELLANGIEPYLTMYHWELPYALYEKGGFANDESVDWFANYAKVIAENFSDRVKNIFTFNEPQIFIGLGYIAGIHAPGLKVSYKEVFKITHNVLKSHGAAVKMLRKYGAKDLKVGIAPTSLFHYPATDSKEDIEAARLMTMGLNPNPAEFAMNVTWFSDPIFFGKYPKEGLKMYAEYLPEITEEDMELISQPIDFYGQNIYNGSIVKMGEDGKPLEVKREIGYPVNSLDWPITPQSMYYGPKFLYERYHTPIIITENGMACHDVISLDGKVHDPNRIDFLNRYLLELKKAVNDGIDVFGYLTWSLMDNFEWHSGYSKRFGLVYVDFNTYKRTVKDSAYWYQKVIESNGEIL